MPGKGQDQEIAAAANGALETPTAYSRLLDKMEAMAELDAAFDEGYSGSDLEAILTAESEEEMMAADDRPSINAKMLSGCALEIYSFAVKVSTDTEISNAFTTRSGKKIYLLIDASRIDKSGEKSMLRLPEPGVMFQWNTSARFIVAKLFWYLEHGYFDGNKSVRARIEGTDLPGGRSVEKLKPLNSPTLVGSAEPPF